MLFTFGAKDEVDGKSDEDGEREDEPRRVGDVRVEGVDRRERCHVVDGVGI
jgi:hypothetical protein